jgi:hypothetical protein
VVIRRRRAAVVEDKESAVARARREGKVRGVF